jgi:hypothetical protein
MTAALALSPDQNARLQPRRSEDQSHASLSRLHLVSPSSPNQHGGDEETMQSPTIGRTVLGLCKNEVRDKIATALRSVPSAKHIARDTADAGHPLSSDSAENLRSGINIPNGFNLILLARIYPELRAVVRQLIDGDFDQDPRAYAMFIEAMRYAQEKVK